MLTRRHRQAAAQLMRDYADSPRTGVTNILSTFPHTEGTSMTWGMSMVGKRAEILARLDAERDAQTAANADAGDVALCRAATEMVRATIGLAGQPQDPSTGQRGADAGADDYNVSVNASGHVYPNGGTNLYLSVTVQPPAQVGTLASGPTPNELAAHEATERIRLAAQVALGSAGTTEGAPAPEGAPAAGMPPAPPAPAGAPAQ